MKSANQDLEARRPVWEALSTLFLDTDVTLLRDYRSRLLAESPYTLDELDRILADEVFPVCCWNFASIAGVWTGFDPEWLETKILRRLRRRRKWRLRIGPRLFVQASEWKRTKARVESLRSAAAAAESAGAKDSSPDPRG